MLAGKTENRQVGRQNDRLKGNKHCGKMKKNQVKGISSACGVALLNKAAS